MRDWRVCYLDNDDEETRVWQHGKRHQRGPMGIVPALKHAILEQRDYPHLTFFIEHAITKERVPVRGFPECRI